MRQEAHPYVYMCVCMCASRVKRAKGGEGTPGPQCPSLSSSEHFLCRSVLSCVCYACLASCQHFLPQPLMNSEPWLLQWGQRSCSTPLTPHDLNVSESTDSDWCFDISFNNKLIARISKNCKSKYCHDVSGIKGWHTGACTAYTHVF